MCLLALWLKLTMWNLGFRMAGSDRNCTTVFYWLTILLMSICFKSHVCWVQTANSWANAGVLVVCEHALRRRLMIIQGVVKHVFPYSCWLINTVIEGWIQGDISTWHVNNLYTICPNTIETCSHLPACRVCCTHIIVSLHYNKIMGFPVLGV